MIVRLLALILVVITLCSCAGTRDGGSASSGRAASSPRVRCLSDPHETGMRPLIFLMCVESP
jgi:hypothetical protein